MNFELTEEQRMIQEMARNFAEKEVAPEAARLDDTHEFPTELAKKMGELGLMGVAVPEEYDGAGMDYVCYVIALEEICAACANCGSNTGAGLTECFTHSIHSAWRSC